MMGRRRKSEVQKRFDMKMGARITELRHMRRLSAAELARQIGLSRQMVYDYESGRATVPHEVAARMSEALRVTSAAFLAGKSVK